VVEALNRAGVDYVYPAVRYGPPHGTLYLDILTRLGEATAYADLPALGVRGVVGGEEGRAVVMSQAQCRPDKIPRDFQYLGTLSSTSTDHASMPPARFETFLKP
jgi:hypothetical protein